MADEAHVSGFDLDFRYETPKRLVLDALRLMKDVGWIDELCPSKDAWHFKVLDQRAVPVLTAAGLEIH